MKKVLIVLMVFALLAVYPAGNFYSIIKENYFSETDTQEGISYISGLASADVSKAEKLVSKADAKRNYVPKTAADRALDNIKKLEKGKTTYKKIFRNVCIAGDSLMHGLASYNILNNKMLVTQVSASLYHLEDNFNRIVRLKPKVLILHYGINMLGYGDSAVDGYISLYKSIIKKFKKSLPDTKIVVSSIFPVDRKVAKRKIFSRIGEYNKALKKMCKSMKVVYLHNSPAFKKAPYSYGGDGIHLSKEFYSDYWLKFVIKEVEIV